MSNILTFTEVSKNYGSLQALDKLSFEVEKGQVFGILGPNGSGKTTALGIALGVTVNNAGTYSWFGGMNDKDARKKIGSLLETPNFYPYMNGVQNLKINATIKDISFKEIDRVLELVNLHDRKKTKFKAYSLGMKQRLAIANALLGDPEVLVLDEPTNGLDPNGIAEIRSLIIELGNQNKTIIMASHLLDEVEKICNHIVVLKKGNLIAAGAVDAILATEHRIELSASDNEALKNAMKTLEGFHLLNEQKGMLLYRSDREIDVASLNRSLFEHGISLSHSRLMKKSLEEQFLEITK